MSAITARASGGANPRPPPSPAAPPASFLLGGSTVYGTGGSYPHIDNRFALIYNHQLIDAFLERMLNEAFPSKRWEVVNAAASGYRLHQQLALLQSRILRCQPDYVLLMDGYNDFIELYHGAQAGPGAEFDVYENTPGREEFDALANPRSFRSARVFIDAWVGAHSALYRLARNRLPGTILNPWRRRAVIPRVFGDPVQLTDLTPAERLGAAAALEHVARYTHTASQIHRVLSLDRILPVFLLQPILILSRKSLTDVERQMVEYERRQAGPLYCYLFRQVYSEIERDMREAAGREGFQFLNLEGVFDRTPEQTFTDFAHLAPAGNRIVAERLFEILGPRIAAECR